MEKKAKKKFVRKGKFSRNTKLNPEKSLNPNVEFKKELFKDEERTYKKYDDEDYRDRAKERRIGMNLYEEEDSYEQDNKISKYDGEIPYQFHLGLDMEQLKKNREELEKQQNLNKTFIESQHSLINKSSSIMEIRSKENIFNSVIGSKIFEFIKDNKLKKPCTLNTTSYNQLTYYEYDMTNPDIPAILKKNIKNKQNEYRLKIDVSDSLLNILEDSLCRKRRRERANQKEKNEEQKKNQSKVKKNVVVDDDEEIFPDKKTIEIMKVDEKINRDDDDDIFKYKEISLMDLLKKKK